MIVYVVNLELSVTFQAWQIIPNPCLTCSQCNECSTNFTLINTISSALCH